MSILIEACVDGIRSAKAAVAGGADRMELCVDRASGGLTPSSGLIESVREISTLPLAVLIRPRPGDFLYDDSEFSVMRRNVSRCRELGAEAVVFGIVLPDGTTDQRRVAALAALARPMDVVFHRAFDLTPDVDAALDTLIELGIDRVLTSGQGRTAYDGIPVLKRLVERAVGRIGVLAGGGIKPANARAIVTGSGVTEIHMSAAKNASSGMEFQRTDIVLGPTGYGWSETDAELIRRTREAVSLQP